MEKEERNNTWKEELEEMNELDNIGGGKKRVVRLKKNPVVNKIIAIVILAFVLMLPSGLIMSLINERKSLGNNALMEVSSKWGQQQNIGGPVLYIPIVREWIDIEKNVVKNIEFLKVLPSFLDINGEIQPEIRYRGIYKFALYTTKIKFKGDFTIPDLAGLDLPEGEIKWDEAFILFGVSDMIGIRDNIKVKWNGEANEFSPGLKSKDIFESGVSSLVKVKSDEKNTFEFDLNIKGSEEITFLPLGKETTVMLKSKWGEPSFIGGFLPEERNVTKDNFEAKWKVFDLNRNYPQYWTGEMGKEEINASKFGIKFLVPIDEYKQTMRAVKYMIMFVGLTFIIFFFVEILNKRRIHPIQYLIVGFSLILFYLLLLSISEHINFNIAYIISTIAVVLLIGLYSISILGSKKMGIYISVFLTLLYGFLYILLLNQDYSLLMGTLGLFILLSTVMYLSRNIKWYEIEL